MTRAVAPRRLNQAWRAPFAHDAILEVPVVGTL
jgi:hypothetical protein